MARALVVFASVLVFAAICRVGESAPSDYGQLNAHQHAVAERRGIRDQLAIYLVDQKYANVDRRANSASAACAPAAACGSGPGCSRPSSDCSHGCPWPPS
jgi:hypothetical protein